MISVPVCELVFWWGGGEGGKKKSKEAQPGFAHTTWHHYLVAGHALGGKLGAVAVTAHQPVPLAGEGLVGQGAVAAEAAKTVRVVVSVLVEELLREEGQGETEVSIYSLQERGGIIKKIRSHGRPQVLRRAFLYVLI